MRNGSPHKNEKRRKRLVPRRHAPPRHLDPYRNRLRRQSEQVCPIVSKRSGRRWSREFSRPRRPLPPVRPQSKIPPSPRTRQHYKKDPTRWTQPVQPQSGSTTAGPSSRENRHSLPANPNLDWFVWLIWSIWLVRFDQTHESNQTNQNNQLVALQAEAKSVQYTDASIGLALLIGDPHLHLAHHRLRDDRPSPHSGWTSRQGSIRTDHHRSRFGKRSGKNRQEAPRPIRTRS